MQALYAYELGGGDAPHVIDTLIKPSLVKDDTGLKFSTSLFLRVIDRTDELDTIIKEYVANWEISRIALVDRLLLRMAICEMLTFEDIPPKVSINEVIEVAKRYSTANSGKFINGILDAVLLRFQNDGRLKKSGRGLIGMDTIRDRAQ